MDQFVFSQGSMQTKINNKIIDDKSYEFTYDGDMGKGFVKNNLDAYYVELDNDDLKKIFKKDKKDSVKLETKLKSLLNIRVNMHGEVFLNGLIEGSFQKLQSLNFSLVSEPTL